MSRRRLVFTEHQVYFECNTMNCWECLPSNLDRVHVKGRDAIHDYLRQGMFGRNEETAFARSDPTTMTVAEEFLKYLVNIQEFTARKIRMDSDSLDAFRGVMRSFHAKPSPIYSLWGIPWSLHLGNKENMRHDKYLIDGLAWYHMKEDSKSSLFPKRRSEFPSWSWAGWEGQVTYPERITRSADRPGGWDLKTRTPITGMWCHLSEDMSEADLLRLLCERKAVCINLVGLPYRQFFMIFKCPGQDGKAGCSRIGLFDVNVVSPQNDEVCNYNNGDRRDWVIY
ncbi:hypothetical protein MGG_16331 [Pyricularia oryzae 70-15]|uniref:Heterokaryon incompatibility domain-containing protein n=3 Tax=Pyricularia oryzae TaxID=318829 RepID=G4MKI4_PYRO7|nr:uncharacterized protein MGG_16331 [Pyricularia oryzae 70-15]EHA57573.1 hypothetical protein MGG_16331 [Pyricularia oryzae 70-15]